MSISLHRRFIGVATLLALAASFLITVWPEPASVALTPERGWGVDGHAGRFRLDQFPEVSRHVRRSAVAAPEGLMFRSWTPEHNVQAIGVVSPPFRAPTHLMIPVTGATRTPSGKNSAFLSCSTHAQRRPVFLGSASVQLVEAVVELPSNWCQGQTRLHLVGLDEGFNVGVGAAFKVSALSALKRSFFGLFPFLTVTMLVVGVIGWVGAAAARRLEPLIDPPAAAAAALGLTSLIAFYAYALVPNAWSWSLPLVLAALLLALSAFAGRRNLVISGIRLRPYLVAWTCAALAYFALANAASNGLGHWDPNYRFWPARWSSDNELPWTFAEALRLDQPLKGLFGGAWEPTDRPPLMVGAYLLVADLFAWLQSGNDGTHLRGLAYNAAAIALGALWLPAAMYMLHRVFRLSEQSVATILALVAILPFSIFNTIYGWPKAFGAAFALVATSVAIMAVRSANPTEVRRLIASFGLFSALSMLSHGSSVAFLGPLGFWLAFKRIRTHMPALVGGAALAAVVYATWPSFQRATLSTHDPVTRYALTGDPGFSQPSQGLFAAVADRYSLLSLSEWLGMKGRMLLQPVWPGSADLAPFGLRSDWGEDATGFLRAWDSMFLSAGNVLIVVAAILAIAYRFGWLRHWSNAEVSGEGLLRTSALLIGLSAGSWLLIAGVFMVPLILHVWPYAAIFVAAGAGLASLLTTNPALFSVLASAQWLYLLLVWFVMPLREAAFVSLPAAGFAAVALMALVPLLLRRHALEQTQSTMY